MTIVGIDVSKGKSMVAAMKPGGELVAAPYEVRHSDIELSRLALNVLCMEPDTRVVMEATGRYHEPVAALLHSEGIFVSILNPLLIKQSGAGSLRKVKSDPKDALKIAKYGLDNWSTLREYTPMEAIRQQLKLCARQCDLYNKSIAMLTNNLISLSDKTFPGVNELFSSPEKADGHLKWVDFYRTFWHCDCINRMSPDTFGERYKKWCKRKGYHFSADAADALYAASCGLYTTLPRDNNARLLVTVAADQLIALRENQSKLEAEMLNFCKQLPEYETVMAMYGVGKSTGPHLMAELGDVRRFLHRSSIVAFAGVDPGVVGSGKMQLSSVATSKRGSPQLRKALFQVVSTYVKCKPENEAVYQFYTKKRDEGKPFFVCTTAAANKFLRIYYARVKECLNAAESATQVEEG